jgi:isocitrate dehydrogenase
MRFGRQDLMRIARSVAVARPRLFWRGAFENVNSPLPISTYHATIGYNSVVRTGRWQELFLDQNKSYRLAAIPGDGIGKDVIAAGVEVLQALAARDGGFKLDVESFDWGSDYYKKHGVMMPENGRETLKSFDAIYFGAVGAPDVPDHVTLWGLRLAICQPFDQYANVRPTRILPGIEGPLRNVAAKDLDWVIVR